MPLVVRIHWGCPVFLSIVFTWFSLLSQYLPYSTTYVLYSTVLNRRVELDLLRISREGLSVLNSRNGPLTLTWQLNLSFSVFVLYVLYERTSGRSTDTETRGCALSPPLTSITDGITVLTDANQDIHNLDDYWWWITLYGTGSITTRGCRVDYIHFSIQPA